MFTKNLSQTKYGAAYAAQRVPEQQKWITPQEPDKFYRGGLRSLAIYENLIKERQQKYPQWKELITEEADEIARAVQENGFYKIENFWDTDFLDQIKEQTLNMMANPTPDKVKYPQDGRHTQIVFPLKNIPLTNEMATNKTIQSIATAFFNCMPELAQYPQHGGCLPALGTTNLRLSEASKSINAGTNMFHKDFNSPIRLIKFFTYFDDVPIEKGPFTYVAGSNRQLPSQPHWSSQHRWPDETIESIYGKDRVTHLTANYGDLLIATTNGFHKGLKLQTGSRLMFTLNYVIHPELGGQAFNGPPQGYHQVLKETFEQIDPSDQHLYDFMDIV
tara:strand:+ start:1845 stop:2840 length:996 start_codon:yes stop_codon:yes gene_type:complete